VPFRGPQGTFSLEPRFFQLGYPYFIGMSQRHADIRSVRMIRASLHEAGIAVSAPTRRTSARAGAHSVFEWASPVRLTLERGERGSEVAASRATRLPPDAGMSQNLAGEVNKDAGSPDL
jgi:hypothetical protein